MALARVSYYRCSTADQSVEAQRSALGGNFKREFVDENVSGATIAASRPGFAKLLDYVREGDEVHVFALDRIGRDALDVQATVRRLLDTGVRIEVQGIGTIGRGVGEIIVAVLAQIADLERARIRERCESGREAARESLATTGRTHRGKVSLGRPHVADVLAVRQWRDQNGASINATASHFSIGLSTVKRYCAK